MESFKEYLKEDMAGPGFGDLNLSVSQKRVLNKVAHAGDPQLAVNALVNAEDNRNLMAAVKELADQGYLTTEPADLGPDDEPTAIELTDAGQAAIDKQNIENDPNLLSPDEKEQSAPQEPLPGDEMGMGGMGGMAPPPSDMGMGGELGAPEDELGGEEGPEGEMGEPGEEPEMGDMEGEPGEEELPPEEPEPEEPGQLKGKGVNLELSSWFHDINDLAKFYG